MNPRLVLPLMAALLLAHCGAPERPSPPYFVIPPAAPRAPAQPEPPTTRTPTPQPHSQLPVQLFLSGPGPDEFMRGPTPVPEPTPAAVPFYTPSYNGPVTGYGPGGLAQPPGAPPNPPYPSGGLMPTPGSR